MTEAGRETRSPPTYVGHGQKDVDAPPSASRLGIAIVILALAVTSSLRAQETQGRSAERPGVPLRRLIDTSLRAATLDAAANRPAVSPDGKLLAFVVTKPMLRARPPIERFPFRSRRPTELLIHKIGTQETKKVSPGGASGWQPVWTPDGRTLVFYSDSGDGVRLWAYDAGSGESRRVSDARIAEGFIATTPAQIDPAGREAYVALEQRRPPPSPPAAPTVEVHLSGKEMEETAARPAGNVDPGFARSHAGDLAAVLLTSGEVRMILQADANPPPQRPRLSPSGRWLFYSSPPRHNVWLSGGLPPTHTAADFSTDLAVVPSAGGTPTLLEADVDLDAVRWHPNQDILAYLKGGELGVVEVSDDGRWTRRKLGRASDAFGGTPFAFRPDGRSLLVGRRGGGGAAAPGLALLALDGGAATRISMPTHLSLVDVAVDSRGVLWPPAAGSAAALLKDEQTRQAHVWRLDLATGIMSETWSGPGQLVFAETSNKPNGIIASFEDSRSPADLFWFSPGFSERRRLTRISPELDDAVDDLAGSIEYFTTDVPSFDGTLRRLRTAVIMPPGAARDGTARGIVCVYPGADFSASAELFGAGEKCGIPSYVLGAKRFAVILPHLEKRPRYTKGNVAQEYADALLPIVYRAAALGYVDIRRLALFGHSQGAYAATAIISETNLFRATVAASSLTYDLVGGFGYMRPGFKVPNLVPLISHQMSAPPWEDLKRYIANSPYLQADKLTTPLLLVVGSSDRFPHVEEAGKLFNALLTYDKTAQLAVYQGEDHLLFRGSLANTFDLWTRMLEFLDRYVP